MIKNATIGTANINIERTFIDSWLHLDYGGSGQGFGGFCLYNPSYKGEEEGRDFTGLWISRILETLEVVNWEDLPGKPLRVKIDKGVIIAIGHFLKDNWFNPKEEFEQLKKREG